jgi:hypothetical protein
LALLVLLHPELGTYGDNANYTNNTIFSSLPGFHAEHQRPSGVRFLPLSPLSQPGLRRSTAANLPLSLLSQPYVGLRRQRGLQRIVSLSVTLALTDQEKK